MLAMAGARELTMAGTDALPLLMRMLGEDPELFLPVLKRCVRQAGIPKQALRAAVRLAGKGQQDAAEVLVALGPFGAQALQEVATRTGRELPAEAQRVLERIREDWPEAEDAFETLGQKPERWRRWHRRARPVL
jgi:hypothetical protein